MRRGLFLLLSFFLLHAAALAAEPVFAPQGAWIEDHAVPAPDPALADRPFQMLLMNTQSLYGPEYHDHFTQTVFVIQNVQGLQALGNIVIPWQPDRGELIVHKARILRGSQVIDLLGEGREVTVLRRENNLESAMLDGVLTAVLPAAGLAVGDILDYAFTLRERGGTLPNRGEAYFSFVHGSPVRNFRLRQVWPSSMTMRWRASGAFERATSRRTRFGTELLLALDDIDGSEPPANAPARFLVPDVMQLTGYRDWAEVSADLAPFYERASELAPNSPLQEQIDRIAAQTSDPRARAMAALRLVQDEIRYFALGMDEGSYLPASADQTWARRYGDCKGKTTTLLALLRGLGIESEAVLVHSSFGDGLDQRLPQLIMFDHVIVRARIDGRSYWLDGTRSGDRDLEALASSTLQWGLPVRASGARLEPLPMIPPQQPLREAHLTFDATGGLDGPVPLRVELIMRGDLATSMRDAISQIGREAYFRQVRESRASMAGDDEETLSIDLRDDPGTGDLAVIIDARAHPRWQRLPGGGYRMALAAIDLPPLPERPAGRNRDVPIALAFPHYGLTVETVLLPDGGRGFSLEGESFERRIAGTRIERRLSLADGRAVARTSVQLLQSELSASAARAAAGEIKALRDNTAYLRAPTGLAIRTPATQPRRSGGGEAADFVASGFDHMQTGRLRQALADFDRAVELAPDWAFAHANRGIALTHLRRYDEAEAALAEAIRRDQSEFVIHQGYGFLHLRRDRPEDALRALTRSLEIDPDNAFTLERRADAYERLGRLDEALADIETVVRLEPDNLGAAIHRARLLAHRGDADAAVGLLVSDPHDPNAFLRTLARGDLLRSLGRPDEAAEAYADAIRLFDAMTGTSEEASPSFRVRLLSRMGRTAEAIALADNQLRRYQGHAPTLAARCEARLDANRELERALRDCTEALEYDSGLGDAAMGRGLILLRLERWAEAARAFDRLIAEAPDHASALFGRGLARLGSGQSEAGERDLAAARRYAFDVAAEFRRLGFAAPAEPAAQARAALGD